MGDTNVYDPVIVDNLINSITMDVHDNIDASPQKLFHGKWLVTKTMLIVNNLHMFFEFNLKNIILFIWFAICNFFNFDSLDYGSYTSLLLF